MRHPSRPSPALILALVAYAALTLGFVREPGLVGEVDLTWGLPAPPATIVAVEPLTWASPPRAPHAGDRAGGAIALDAAQVRPLESLVLGAGPEPEDGLRIPLAVNHYTGGLPDLPSRMLFGLTGSVALVRGLHLFYGLLLLGFVWRMVRLHQGVVAAGAAALWLSTDWSFLYYRQVLGGTEAWLIAASLLLLRALWDRRWAGGGMAVWGLALAIGVGMHAKITFAAVLAAAAAATLLTRWDRGQMGQPPPPPPRHLVAGAAILLLLALPLGIALAHHALAVPETPHVRSHDFLGLQLERLRAGVANLWSGGFAPAREQPSNLLSFLVQPLSFFERACGATGVPGFAAGRVAGWLVLVAGTFLAWRDRDPRPQGAMLRWLSLAVPLAVGLLFLLNRDVHHQAMLTGWIALWGGLSVDRLASLISPPRSPARARACLAILLPWMTSGALASARTDAVLRSCDAPVVLAEGQQAVVDLLRAHRVEQVLAIDYDLYGALDILAPDIRVVHGWGAMSRARDRRETAAHLFEAAVGGHLLLVRPSAPTIYSHDPSEREVGRIAEAARVTLEEEGRLIDAKGAWARLYRVEPAAR